jgi:hypothetical protein
MFQPGSQKKKLGEVRSLLGQILFKGQQSRPNRVIVSAIMRLRFSKQRTTILTSLSRFIPNDLKQSKVTGNR